MMMEIEKDNQVGESVSSFVQSENFWEEMTAMHSETTKDIPPAIRKKLPAPALQDRNLDKETVRDMISIFKGFGAEIDRLEENLKSNFGEEELAAQEKQPNGATETLKAEHKLLDEQALPVVEEAEITVQKHDPWAQVEKPHLQKAGGGVSGDVMTVGETIRHGTLWDDADVTAMKPVRVVSLISCIDEYDHSEEGSALRRIALQLGGEATQPANVGQLLSVASVGGAMVATGAGVAMQTNATLGSDMVLRTLAAVWVAAFVMNVVAVSMPGRLDRMYAEKVHLKPWQSMFEPASWAFAIWAVIYVLELLVTLGVLGVLSLGSGPSGALSVALAGALPWWTLGNAAQTMWCYVFRPAFSDKLYVPTACLALASAAYCFTHWQVCRALQSALTTPGLGLLELWQLRLTRTALSIHTAWLIFSAVVTLNSWIVVSLAAGVKSAQTTAGFASAFFVGLLGMALSWYSADPLFALTTAWALWATAARSTHKATMVPTAGDRRATSADVHESLAGIEFMLSAVALGVSGVVLMAPAARALVANLS